MAFASAVYRVAVTGTTLNSPVQIRLPVSMPPGSPSLHAGSPEVALLAVYDSAGGQWHVVPADFDPLSRTLTSTEATLTSADSPDSGSAYRLVLLGLHVSLWSALTVDTSKIAAAAGRAATRFFTSDAYVPQPSCPGSDQLDADGIKVASDKGDLIGWCVGAAGTGGADLVEMNNRTYTIQIDYPATWTAQRVGDADPIFDRAVNAVAKAVTATDPGMKAILVDGGATVRFSVPAGSTGETRAAPSSTAYLVDALVYGADTLAMTYDDIPGVKSDPTKTAKAIGAAFTSGDCLRSVDQLAHSNVTDATSAWGVFYAGVGLATGCLGAQWKSAYGLSGFVASFVVGLITWLVDGVKAVLEGLRGALDTLVYFNAYKVAVAAGQAASFTAFAGQWYGHTRGLTISASGVATESIGDGCCDPVINVTYKLSNPQQNGGTWTVTATVTAVQVHPGWHYEDQPAPHMGEKFKLTLDGGIIVSSLVGTNYCSMQADETGACGA